MKYIERALEKKLLEVIKNYKSVLITGSRQVGKSTLLKNIFPDYKYVSLDDPFLEQQAKENGSMFMMLNLNTHASTLQAKKQEVPYVFQRFGTP